MNTEDLKKQDVLEKFVRREVIYCQSGLVEMLMAESSNGCKPTAQAGYNMENITNFYPMNEDGEESDDGNYPEIFEWWLVTDWFAEKLEEQKECVLKTNYGTYWGRCTTGQAISLDAVVERIYDSLNHLRS